MRLPGTKLPARNRAPLTGARGKKGRRMANYLHRGDLPAGSTSGRCRDQFRDHGAQPGARPALPGAALGRRRRRAPRADPAGQAEAPNLAALLADPERLKLFHFGRFDIAVLLNRFGVLAEPVYCTKIASRLARTYTDRHGLKDLVRELLDIDISKQQQSSDWGAAELSQAQVDYAASDVLLPAPVARGARRAAAARGAGRAGAGLLRLPAAARPARPRRLGRRRHLRPYLTAPMRAARPSTPTS